MKKVSAAILSLALCAAMSTTAFAADTGIQPSSHDVNAKLVDNTVTPNVYSVDIAWGEMQFTYTKSGSMDWNKETHQYKDNTKGEWTAVGNTVSVTNHSNQGVNISLTYNKNEGYQMLEGTLSQSAFTLPDAVNKAVDAKELTQSATLTLQGVLPDSVKDFTAVGSVTVTVQ